jgi:RNA polymerase sigma-70 factor (ECF subfamily)
MTNLGTTPTGSTLTPEEIVREYGPKVYSLARRMLGRDSDAEDVTQDVLLTVIRKLPTFRGESTLGTWLHRITVNAALGYRRKRAHRAEHEIHDPLGDFGDDGHHRSAVRRWSATPETELVNRETQQLIEQAMDTLPELYRDVYVLADIEGLPNAEIADILGIHVPAVKSRLHRARLMMRNALAPHFEESSS